METKFPYLEFAYPGLKDVSERKGRRFIKTHLPTQLLPESLARSKAKVMRAAISKQLQSSDLDFFPGKVLYISRNPKDVCVSYFHFAKMLRYIDFRGDFGKFVRQLFIADRGAVQYNPTTIQERSPTFFSLLRLQRLTRPSSPTFGATSPSPSPTPRAASSYATRT